MAITHNQILPQGTPLGVYEIKEVTKVDATCINYRAWNHHLKETVLIQEYFPHDFAFRAADGHNVEFKSTGDKEYFDCGLKAFLAQAGILAEIEHPNLHNVENVLQFNGTAYLIRPNLEGATLAKLAEAPGAVAETELKFILLSILDALKTVHQHGQFHGDIQPDSILLSKQGEPVLTAFDSSKSAIAARTGKFVDFLATGYAAPELYELSAAVPAAASDLYALGATIYFCITGSQPSSAQNRINALNKGEPDPIVSLAKTQTSQYSADLLQTLDWMLQPAKNQRPHSVDAIITQLRTESPGEATVKQESNRDRESRPYMQQPLLTGVVAALAGLVVFALWMFNKPAQIKGDKAEAITVLPLPKDKPQEAPVSAAIQNDPTASQPAGKDKHEPDVALSSGPTQNELNKTDKQVQSSNPETHQKTSAENKVVENDAVAPSAAKPINASDADQKISTHVEPQTTSASRQKIAVTDTSSHRPKKLSPPKKAPQPYTVAGYLAAARKAMKDVRFTTPPGNNAYEYYQKVLAQEPGNTEALAGRERIVHRYTKYIRLSKSVGELERAKRVLKKAESVSPNDPQLLKIREELYDDH